MIYGSNNPQESQHNREVEAMLAKFSVSDPMAFDHTVHHQDASVVGNAATVALLAAGLSAAMGSKRPGRAALMAGVATASITAVNNAGAEVACQHSNELLK